MIYNDIINPLLNDFLTRVTGFGGQYFKSSAINRLNDFVDYLSELTYPNFDFAFYPLRQDQNIGNGKVVFGIGNLATGTNILFKNEVNWTTNGIYFDSVRNCGEIDFSGRVVGDFQFRKDTSSVFYFLQHTRQSFPITFYRPDVENVPYFCFDLSNDQFSVTSPNFSKNRFRQRGTTYIYDEIYGEDQKGLQIDWSQKPTEKFYIPEALSFYQMDKNIPSGQFICINANISFDYYSLKSIFGRDPNTLSGKFLPPYSSRPLSDDSSDRSRTEYFFPRRMVIGAGVSNTSRVYDVDGMSHICPGVLILRGDYSHKADEIARKMAEGIGVVNETFIPYSVEKEYSNINASISGLRYVQSLPKPIPPYKNSSSFAARIKSIFLRFIGSVTFEKFDWGILGTTSIEWSDVQAEVSGQQKTGILNYNYPILGSPQNKPITGFVSGNLNPNGSINIFPPGNISGQSGYFFLNQDGSIETFYFPPNKTLVYENIIGFISGYKDEYGNFQKSNNDLFVSGYFLENQQFYLNPNTGEGTNKIIGYISGVMDLNNRFSGFHESDINEQSGYIDGNTLIQFPPYKYVSGFEPVIGYIKGFVIDNVFNPFYDERPLLDQSGNITGYATLSDPDISGYFYKNQKIPFPTGSGFDGFNNVPYFYPDLGYEFSGFFIDSSGIIIDDNEPTGYMTGFIGSKAAIYKSGIYNQFNNISGFGNAINYNISGFFVESSGFSGLNYLWDLIGLESAPGILTGFIGSYNYIGTLNSNINFDGKSGFNPLSGYYYSGFFVGGSGFSGLSGNSFGFGAMTGIIGYRVISDNGFIPFNGFTGVPKIDSTYYSNVFVNFDKATGFSGISSQNSGLGIFTGIISSGNFAGDIAKFQTSTGISNYTGYDFQVSGLYYDIGVLESGLSITGYSGETNFYYTGIFNYTGLINISPEISGLNYYDGIYSGIIGASGFLGESPIKSGEFPPIIGFISGYINEYGQFTGFNILEPTKNSYGYFVSGIKYFLPTGNSFSGFQYVFWLDTPGGFDFSGFFPSHVGTGYVGDIPGSGILTGYIGVRKFYVESPLFNPAENSFVSGTITGFTYKSGVLETGVSGLSGQTSLFFAEGNYASGNCNISSIEYFAGQSFEIYPYIRAVSGFAFINSNVSVAGYYEDMPDIGYNNQARITPSITSIRYFGLLNEFTFTDSGVLYRPIVETGYAISTSLPPSGFDNIEYRVVATLLSGDFPSIIEPPSIAGISDIEGLTEDPYFDNVVLLLNMSGKNLSRNILDSSKYHRKVVSSIGGPLFDENLSYTLSGITGTFIPFINETINYTLSGITGEFIPFINETINYTLSGSIVEPIELDLVILKESGNVGVSGGSELINYNVLMFSESGIFTVSGNSNPINYNVTIVPETGGRFGISGVILITGTF